MSQNQFSPQSEKGNHPVFAGLNRKNCFSQSKMDLSFFAILSSFTQSCFSRDMPQNKFSPHSEDLNHPVFAGLSRKNYFSQSKIDLLSFCHSKLTQPKLFLPQNQFLPRSEEGDHSDFVGFSRKKNCFSQS